MTSELIKMDLFNSTNFTSSKIVETSNITRDIHVPKIWNMTHLIITSVVLGVMILCTIIGNVFVIAAIILEKNLHNVANYLILSLAVSDCMVASIVMPISAVNELHNVANYLILSLAVSDCMVSIFVIPISALNEVTQHWFMGAEVCDMWIAMDVSCCTASIYGLVAISIDRYWAVTNVDYVTKRTKTRICVMITIVWIAALSISIPSILLFKDDNDPDETGICMISQDPFFTIFSTFSAFYLPTIILLMIYAKIFSVARKRISRKKFSEKRSALEARLNKNIPLENNSASDELELQQHGYPAASRSDTSEPPLDDNVSNCNNDTNNSTNKQIDFKTTSVINNAREEIMKAKKEKDKLKRKRERKIARTLTIITGSFIICWLPFFIIAISTPFIRPENNIPRLVKSITLWLGYFNSLLNPLIYTMFNEEFRKAFNYLLFKRCLRRGV